MTAVARNLRIPRATLLAIACTPFPPLPYVQVINAYPKNLPLRAKSAEDLNDWLAALMLPLTTQGLPYHGNHALTAQVSASAAADAPSSP